MVSLREIAVAYAVTSVLGVNAGLCRPSTRTSLTLSGSETQTLASAISTSVSGSSTNLPDTTTLKDLTSSNDGTTTSNPTTSGHPTLSTSETLSHVTSSGNPTTSDIATSSNPPVSDDSTTSGNPTTSRDITTSNTSTMSGDSAISSNPTTFAETTASTDITSSVESATSAETTSSTDITTSVESTTAAGSTVTADTTTTSAEPTSTTSVCVEPTNMLRQPGFEPSDDGDVWGFYWGGGDIEVDPQHARTDDGLAVLPVPDGQERRMEQRIHIVPDTEYTVSFYYAVASPPSDNTQCFLFATFDYYTTLVQVPLPSDTAYHLYSASFISADNLDPVIEIGVSCPQENNGYTATVYIDDTSVLNTAKECDATPVDPGQPPKSTLLVPSQPQPARCPVNVVQVPGFEPDNGDQAWAFYNRGEFVQDSSNARTGEWEALLPSGTQSDAIFLEQPFSAQDLEAGETYDYHFFWKPKTLPDNGKCYITGGYNDAVAFTAAEVKSGATSSTGYTIFSVRFTMPSGDLNLQIIFYCTYNNGNQQLGSVYVDDTALIKVGGCEAYPVTGALIENPSFEIRATEDSTYAWFGTNGMAINAGSTSNGPSPNTGNNYLYAQLESTKKSATLGKPLASSLNAGQSYNLEFSWSAGSLYLPGDCSFAFAFGSMTEAVDLNEGVTPYNYQLFQYSFTAAAEVKDMSITVSCLSALPDFVFDDFLLE
ncbi:hypothetical protein ACHAP7_007247 [Fusarium lateritium]